MGRQLYPLLFSMVCRSFAFELVKEAAIYRGSRCGQNSHLTFSTWQEKRPNSPCSILTRYRYSRLAKKPDVGVFSFLILGGTKVFRVEGFDDGSLTVGKRDIGHMPDLPYPKGFTHNGRLTVCASDSADDRRCLQKTPPSRTWRMIEPCPNVHRQEFAALATPAGAVCFVGGRRDNRKKSGLLLEMSSKVDCNANGRWTSLTDYPVEAGDVGAALIRDGSAILACGGIHKPVEMFMGAYNLLITNLAECYTLDLKPKSEWKQVAGLPEALKRVALSTFKDRTDKELVIAVCGMTGANMASRLVAIYDVEADTWTRRSAYPFAPFKASAITAANNRVYVISATDHLFRVSDWVLANRPNVSTFEWNMAEYNYEDDTWRRVDDRRLTFEDYNVALMPDLERLH